MTSILRRCLKCDRTFAAIGWGMHCPQHDERAKKASKEAERRRHDWKLRKQRTKTTTVSDK